MATKKITKKVAKKASKKATKKAVSKKSEKRISKAQGKKKKAFNVPFTGKFHYAVGRRKTAVAQVRVYSKDDATDTDYFVNGKTMKEYFPTSNEYDIFQESLVVTGAQGTVAISVLVRGGGISGQAQAIRLGIARALTKMDEGLRPILKANGLLTRDARVVERKKPGLRKARRSPQWSKR